MKRLLYIIIGLIFSLQMQAQTFPLPGATWYFSQSSFGNPDKKIKWEYTGDSIAGNSRYLLFNTIIAYKTFDSGSNMYTYSKDTSQLRLIERNDSIFYETPIQGRSFICNFNLVTGDSTLSPFFHDWANAGYASPNCHTTIPNGVFQYKVDSFMLHQKAYIVDHGVDMIAGNAFSYYTIEYKILNPQDPNTFNNPVLEQKTFHQRYLFELGQTNVPWESFHVCDYGIDDSYIWNELLCFVDNLSVNTDCIANENDFIYFSINETNTALVGKIYPNPATDKVYIQNLYNKTPIRALLLDMQGKQIISPIIVDPLSTAVMPLSQLTHGVYILKLINDAGEVQAQKIIKN